MVMTLDTYEAKYHEGVMIEATAALRVGEKSGITLIPQGYVIASLSSYEEDA